EPLIMILLRYMATSQNIEVTPGKLARLLDQRHITNPLHRVADFFLAVDRAALRCNRLQCLHYTVCRYTCMKQRSSKGATAPPQIWRKEWLLNRFFQVGKRHYGIGTTPERYGKFGVIEVFPPRLDGFMAFQSAVILASIFNRMVIGHFYHAHRVYRSIPTGNAAFI